VQKRQAESVASASEKAVSSGLFAASEREYGEKYKDHLMEQYKVYVQMADKVSERRATGNAFFLSANALLLSGLGLISSSFARLVLPIPLPMAGVSLAGILLCLVWILLVRSYRQLNTAKFNLICMMEAKLPAAPYKTEWEILTAGKKSKEYRPLTSVEVIIPLIFMILHVLLPVLTFLMRMDPV
jgi:hypothetical protein